MRLTQLPISGQPAMAAQNAVANRINGRVGDLEQRLRNEELIHIETIAAVTRAHFMTGNNVNFVNPGGNPVNWNAVLAGLPQPYVNNVAGRLGIANPGALSAQDHADLMTGFYGINQFDLVRAWRNAGPDLDIDQMVNMLIGPEGVVANRAQHEMMTRVSYDIVPAEIPGLINTMGIGARIPAPQLAATSIQQAQQLVGTYALKDGRIGVPEINKLYSLP